MKLTEITAISPKEIAEQFCLKYKIKRTTIHDNGIIDVTSNVTFDKKQFDQLSVQFGKVDGTFVILYNKLLTSLKGCPISVGKNFDIYGSSQLTSLKDGPTKINGTYYQCGNCDNLQSFEYVPVDFTGEFYGSECPQIKNLKGLPKELKNLFVRGCTGLVSLKGIPEVITKGPLNITGCTNLTSLDYLPREITEGVVELQGTNRVKNLLAFFDIEGKFNLKHDNNEIANIINKHLKNPDRDEGMIECRQELRDAGFSEYTRIK